MFYTGTLGAEPTLGVNNKGTVFYVGVRTGAPTKWPVVRSTDQGRTWKDASPRLAERETHLGGLDPFIWLDKATGRLFDVDYTGPCSLVSFSDDQGKTWGNGEICGHARPPEPFRGAPLDIFDDRLSERPLLLRDRRRHARRLRHHDRGSKSIDGGINWIPTGEPPFMNDPNNTEGGNLGIPGHCGGATGHRFVDQKGTVYVPAGLVRQPVARHQSGRRIEARRRGRGREQRDGFRGGWPRRARSRRGRG